MSQGLQRLADDAARNVVPVRCRSGCRNCAGTGDRHRRRHTSASKRPGAGDVRRRVHLAAHPAGSRSPEPLQFTEGDWHLVPAQGPAQRLVHRTQCLRVGHTTPTPIVRQGTHRDVQVPSASLLLLRGNGADKTTEVFDVLPPVGSAPLPVGLSDVTQRSHGPPLRDAVLSDCQLSPEVEAAQPGMTTSSPRLVCEDRSQLSRCFRLAGTVLEDLFALRRKDRLGLALDSPFPVQWWCGRSLERCRPHPNLAPDANPLGKAEA